jgi:hypothetical protein
MKNLYFLFLQIYQNLSLKPAIIIFFWASQQFSSTRALQKIGATLNRFDFQGVCDEETFDTDMYWECRSIHSIV